MHEGQNVLNGAAVADRWLWGLNAPFGFGAPERRARAAWLGREGRKVRPLSALNFAPAIEKVAGFALKWRALDISEVRGQTDQIARIKEWGRIGVAIS